ncbi:AI-2E family transporter [Aurantibacter crassamenti]|uniref:AI-2E family transporter n=1 Tax=Aurantibacter crassamenti TaxID=1837375 RepID=UPI001939DE88|nr:AI-2E family transporter [Aurantibacter crassamenti]MBM1105886.1 AI-2E family transporter [Aurantibacter crassamenti]
MNQIAPKIIRQIFVLLLILLIGGLIFKEMVFYFSGVLGAITLYVLLHKPMTFLVARKWHPNLAAATLMFASVLAILLPISGAILMLGNKINKAVKNSEKVVAAFKTQLQNFENQFGYDLTSQIDASAVSEWLSKNLQGLVGSTFNIFIAVSIMYFLLFYMLTNHKKLRESLFAYIPISDENLKIIGSETREMVRANALGIPLVAIAQGIVALIGFLIFGIENSFFWAVIVSIGSMIPFVGNLLGTIPVFILSLSSGHTFQAWSILLYGIIIVGSTDNLIRLYVLQKLDNVHPLITLIGIIVGIPLFGFIGLIFGPLLISLFLIIVRIYKKEFGS